MARTQKIILYGGSLFISGLSVSLSTIPEIQIRRVEAQPEDDLEWVRIEAPDVIVAELGIASGKMTLNLMMKFPGVTLIGLDLESDQLLVLSVKQQRAQSAKDLVKVIQAGNAG